MNLPLIEMERPAARAAFLDYRRAVRAGAEAKLGDAQREYEELDRAVMQGYRALAAGRQLLKLSAALADAGVVEVDIRTWSGSKEMRRAPAPRRLPGGLTPRLHVRCPPRRQRHLLRRPADALAPRTLRGEGERGRNPGRHLH